MAAVPWTVRTIDPQGNGETEEVPSHRLSSEGARSLVRELVIRGETLTFTEFVSAHLNSRRGGPSTVVGDAQRYSPQMTGKVGFYLSGPTTYAEAFFALGDEAKTILKTFAGR